MIVRRSDKWLKQAGIVDEDFITTTDTAILFRKMSRYGRLNVCVLIYSQVPEYKQEELSQPS